jgi:hypothetical protein
MTSTPITWAPSKQFVGISGAESFQGNPTAMTFTQLLDSFKPKDVPVFEDDKAWRGSMAVDAFNIIQGTKKSNLSLGGPVFVDGLGFFLRNLMGDLAVTGVPTGSGSTTLSAAAAAGATSISTVASIPASTLVQIGSGATAVVVTTGSPTGSGPYTIPISAPASGLAFAQASAAAVVPVTGPYQYAFSLLNTAGAPAQPPSHTLTHYLGPTATSGARQYPGASLSQMSFMIKPENALLNWTGQATAFPSVTLGSLPTPNGTSIKPIPAWQTAVGIGGPASGGTLVGWTGDAQIDIKRELGVYYAANNSQVPYIIQRGGLSASGKITVPAAPDETALLYMLNNTQPQLQYVISNGLSGTNLLAVQFDIALAAFETAEPETSKTAVGYETTFKCVLNTTNAGGSGGSSPLKITITTNVAPNTY